MRVLLDTCVIIDALQSRDPFSKDAQNIFINAANMRFAGCITAKSVTDIYYITHRATHSDRETRKVLSKIFTLFDIADTAGIDCRKALTSEITDYEDAVMSETAVREDIDYIITRNRRDYKHSPAPVLLPSEFLDMFCSADFE